MLKKYSNEIKIGLLVTAGLLMLVWGINYLKGIHVFSKQRIFYAVYNSVDGLADANPVNINGLKVGQVKDVKFMPGFTGKIVVSIILSTDFPIPDDTKIKIVSADIMGGRAIDLKIGKSAKMAAEGDTLPSETMLSITEEVNRQVAPIKAKAESLLGSMDSVMAVIQNVFNPETRENLAKSVEKIQKALTSLEHATGSVDTIVSGEKRRMSEIFQNIESISKNIRNNNERISAALKNIADITDTLAKAQLGATIMNLKNVIAQLGGVVEKINHGEGSLGKLVNDDSLYTNLNATSRDLDLLVKDLNENPNRYVHLSVFGRKDKKKPVKKP